MRAGAGRALVSGESARPVRWTKKTAMRRHAKWVRYRNACARALGTEGSSWRNSLLVAELDSIDFFSANEEVGLSPQAGARQSRLCDAVLMEPGRARHARCHWNTRLQLRRT